MCLIFCVLSPGTVEESRWFFSPDVEEDPETGAPLAQIEDRRALALAAAAAGEEEEDGPTDPIEPQPRDPTTMVDSVVVLGCSEALAADRLKRLPPQEVLPGHNDEEGFRRRWARYAAINELNSLGLPAVVGGAEAALSPLPFIQDSVEVLELPEATCADVAQASRLLSLYVTKRGVAANYHPTAAEEAAVAAAEASAASVAAEAQQALAREQAATESATRAHATQNHALRRAAVLLEDAMLIEASSAPIRGYLMENVIPALVDGLLDVCKIQPDDPVDYLAEYLFKYAVDTPVDEENAQERPQI